MPHPMPPRGLWSTSINCGETISLVRYTDDAMAVLLRCTHPPTPHSLFPPPLFTLLTVQSQLTWLHKTNNTHNQLDVSRMPFLVRALLQFNETPSHALTTCEPWTRLLVETESPCGKGHVIGNEIELRKTTGQFNIITGIEVEQLKSDTTKAQRYLDASAWWLHRPPFGVERLPVKLIAQDFKGSIVSVDGWNVTSLMMYRNESSAPITLESLGPLQDNLKELRLRGIQVSDFTPFRDLEFVSVCSCETVRDISGLRGCQNLRTLNVSETRVTDVSSLAGAPALEEVEASWSGVTTITGLRTCANLKTVNFEWCSSLDDLSGLVGAPSLEVIEASYSGVSTVAGLSTCPQLKYVNFNNCASLQNLSPLAGAPSLEEIHATDSRVSTITGVNDCPNLKNMDLHGTPAAKITKNS